MVCVELDFFLGPLKSPKLRTAVSRFQPSSPRVQTEHIFQAGLIARLPLTEDIQKHIIKLVHVLLSVDI